MPGFFNSLDTLYFILYTLYMQNPEYEIKEPRGGFRKITLLIVALAITAFLVFAIYYFTKVNKPASSESREVNFMIERGTSMKEIAQHLGQENIISRPWVFETYARSHGAGNKIQAGEYILNANMAIPEIVDILTHGKVVSNARTLTVIEGWTNAQIGSYLVKRQVVEKESDWADVMQKLQTDFKYNDAAVSFNYQGFLFPDTYKLGKNEGA